MHHSRRSAWPTSPQMARVKRTGHGIGPGASSFALEPRIRKNRSALSRIQRERAAQGLHLCVSGNVKKAARQTKILQERPKVLIPCVTIEWKAPEIVEQHGGGDHIEYE